MEKSSAKNSRPPVVVVMGHVDHGKTTLLDYIRRTNVAAKESGGITQHIGAYEITHKDRKITFIDTPGHEAFSKMRSRGARVADVAILVVAADEGVKPQTKEAIEHIKTAELPFVVAFNKIDKPGADAERVKQELAATGVLVEGWGGNIPNTPISAKTGQGVEELLDLILLMADIEELMADTSKPASGVVIESELDSRRGPIATVVILDGTLRRGDVIRAGGSKGKVKRLEDFTGADREELTVSSPARIVGWETLPQVGEQFSAGEQALIETQPGTPAWPRPTIPSTSGDLRLIVKADAAGSLEALGEAILAVPHGDLSMVILESGVGDINESDVKTAHAAGALIAGFRVKINREASMYMKNNPVTILQSDIIYHLLEAIGKEINERLEAKRIASIMHRLEVLAVFPSKGKNQVIGGKVVEGVLEKGMKVDVYRRGEKLSTGKILNLQLKKTDVPRVEVGNECGILFDSQIPIMKGDTLVAQP